MTRGVMIGLFFLMSMDVQAASRKTRGVRVGDMILTPQQAKAVRPPSSRQLQATGFGAFESRPWPAGRLPVLFPSDATAREKTLLLRACARWTQLAAVECVEPGGEPYAYQVVRTSDTKGCYSTVGMGEGGGAIWLGPRCWDLGVLTHELGHGLGLTHEHERTDRDRYIEVLWKNIDPAFQSAYFIIAEDPQGLPYDFFSVMHYQWWAFGTGGRPAFRLRPPYSKLPLEKVGGTRPTRQDGLSLSLVYGVPGQSKVPPYTPPAPDTDSSLGTGASSGR